MTRNNEKSTLRRLRVTPALVVAFVSLFVALSGAALALPGQNTVSSGDIIDNTIKSQDLKDGAAVATDDVVPESLAADDLAPDSVAQSELAPSSVRSSEIGDGIHAHTSSALVDGGAGQNANYGYNSATATCGPGEELISGSGHWADDGAGDELMLSEVTLNHGAESVTVKGGNDSGTDRTVVAVAHCL